MYVKIKNNVHGLIFLLTPLSDIMHYHNYANMRITEVPRNPLFCEEGIFSAHELTL